MSSIIYFASAYCGRGWLYDWPVPSTERQSDWIPAIESSFEEFHRRLDDSPPEWLQRRVRMIDTDGMLSGWRIMMMLFEHETHHRSQIDTYAGLEGWGCAAHLRQVAGEHRRVAGGAAQAGGAVDSNLP